MRKILVLVVMACFLLTGCGGEPKVKVDPYETYQLALNKVNDLDSIHLVLDGIMDVSAAGQSQNMTMSIDMKIVDAETNPQFSMNTSMAVAGSTLQMVQYYKDDYLYNDILGTKSKMPMPFESVMSSSPTDTFTDFDKEVFSKAKVTTTNGKTVMTISADTYDMTEEIIDMLQSSGMDAELDAETIKDLNIKQFDITNTINAEGFLESSKIVMDISFSLLGGTVTAKYDMTMTYKDFGDAVTIEFPDLSEYIEA